MSRMIQIKNFQVFKSIVRYPPHWNLVRLFEWVIENFDPIIVTCGYEYRAEASVHSVVPYRGLDIRSKVFENPQMVADRVNDIWVYDPLRPQYHCAKYHDSGRGEHIHLQAHDRTMMRV